MAVPLEVVARAGGREGAYWAETTEGVGMVVVTVVAYREGLVEMAAVLADMEGLEAAGGHMVRESTVAVRAAAQAAVKMVARGGGVDR